MGIIKFLGSLLGGQNTQSEYRIADPQNLDDDSINARLREIVESGRKIEAIKEARKAYNCGLKEAKDLIEQL